MQLATGITVFFFLILPLGFIIGVISTKSFFDTIFLFTWLGISAAWSAFDITVNRN